MLTSRVSLAFLASVALLGCGGSEEVVTAPPVTPPATEQPETPRQPQVPFTIDWKPCAIPTGRSSVQADCATVDAPAQRGVEGSGTVPVAIYRIKAPKQPAASQMWMLNGGPGGAGFSLAAFVDAAPKMFESIDAYLIDHRGTGESAFLECPETQLGAKSVDDYFEKCSAEVRAQHGAKLDGFSTTESAFDVRDLITSTASLEQKVFVYGGSYGSYWAHRLMQLPDVRVDAVITDGNCMSKSCTFDTPQVFGVDEAIRPILERCKKNDTCRAHLGDDPWAFAANVATKIEGGHCASAPILQKYGLAQLLFSMGAYWAPGLMPLLYRLDRCSESDLAALASIDELFDANSRQVLPSTKTWSWSDAVRPEIASFVADRNLPQLTFVGSTLVPTFGPTPKPSEEHSFSSTLLTHVLASEMISRPAPTVAVLQEKASKLTFKPKAEELDVSYYDLWQVYPRDQYVDGWSNRDVPWLMMQGNYDFQTVFSLSDQALANVENPSLRRVTIDGGGHGVVFENECNRSIASKFLADPRAAIDESCIAVEAERSLDLSSTYVKLFFGTNDAWN